MPRSTDDRVGGGRWTLNPEACD